MSKKKLKDIPIPVEEKPTKQEYAVATYLKKNCPTKKTKFLNHQVNYFYANKAVDTLLDSPWATGKDILFTDRQSVVDYCNKLLKQKFFHRAKKIPITDKDLKPKDLKKKKEKEREEKKKKEIEKKKEKEEKKGKDDEKKENEEEAAAEEESKQDGSSADKDEKDVKEKDEEKEKKKKKKSKIKLDMHLEQVFVDGGDAYVWMYDPIPFWYYIAGSLCLFGAIAVCLFPLWPPSVRKGVYYLSVAAAGFLGVILGLAVLRFIVFVIIWVLTMGIHHLWLLPNLTEDVGFFASFWPLYHYEYRGAGYEKKNKKKKKIKDDDEEREEEGQDKRSDMDDTLDSPDTAAETDKHETDNDRVAEEQTAASETDSENSNSQAFEMVEKDEVDEVELEENEEIPEKGSCVQDLQKEISKDDIEDEKTTES
ncbi:translocation protein SEC62 isoform X2 [Procambarus clarkii]|uniref:translocation protein SEC62 isoform X2 n=1 Tax=Procambarus clarkii TaxID=6728 RepID=UPI001E6776F3|nr:translocation protein SEC62-like isoform X2 [Procambarus clarkii]